ncbi:MAG: hypothetical protein LBD58_00800 [Treponema sp.]|jgi:hypothetical protein|nr:hypothetical protein [Treponema sp.]
MEDALEVYLRPYDEKRPAQLPGEKRESVPTNERHEKREDNGYARKGTCRVFMTVEPLGGKRYVSASDRRTRQEWAREAKPLVTDRHPQTEKAENYDKKLKIR